MADRLDVAGRLAEGRSAVEHTQTYVRASQFVGYEYPDLTARPTQIQEWFDGEDGLDLHALDADCAQVRAADAMVTEALRVQRAQAIALASAWTGPGADAAVAFIQRHCDTAGTLVTEIRAAAQRCESLRDNLWQLVDAKVATAVAIDDRTLAQRSTWLSAATAVRAGDSAARQLIKQEVEPYVDNIIRNEWVAAMRSTRAGVTACFDMVIDRLAATMPVHFEVPGDFSPPSPPSSPSQQAPAQRPVAQSVSPASVLGAPARVEAAAMPSRGTSATPSPQSSPSVPSWSAGDAGLGSGSGLGGGGMGADSVGGLGGLSGLASRIIQQMGGLLGGGPTDDGNRFDDEDRFGEDADHGDADHKDADHKDADHKRPRGKADELQMPEPGKQTGDLPTAKSPVGEPNPPAQPSPPAAPASGTPPNAPPPKSPSTGSTPCEIAANELPQAGQ